jgi:hypothetical protein
MGRNSIEESTMNFLTVEDCLKSRGKKRGVLQGFDQLVRETLERTRLTALSLRLDDNEVGMSCVTVIMTVAADLALAASNSRADIEAGHFLRVAEDALAWAKNRRVGPEGQRQAAVDDIFSFSSTLGATGVAKNRLM